MIDPFPGSPPPWLVATFRPLIDYLGLPTLALHIHEVLFAFVLYHGICLFVAPFISARLFPRIYPALSRRTKFNWDIHVVSLVQSLIVNWLALYVMWTDDERWNMDWKGRVWGYTGGQGLVQAFATGYFLWDAYICTTNIDIFGWGLLAHGWCALFVFGNGFRPFVNFYGPSFILYELSSPFLNLHWFFDKVNMTGSDPQLYNGILLMASFFSCRLCWGTYQTYRVFSDIWQALQYQKTSPGKAFIESLAANVTAAGASALGKDSPNYVFRYAGNRFVPPYLGLGYLGSNAILNMLNVYWFAKMVETIRKRFPPPFGTLKYEIKKEVAVVTGLSDDGSRSVEADEVEIKRRRVKRKT